AHHDIYTLSLHDALPICRKSDEQYPKNLLKGCPISGGWYLTIVCPPTLIDRPLRSSGTSLSEKYRLKLCKMPKLSLPFATIWSRSEEHTSELQSRGHLVC